MINLFKWRFNLKMAKMVDLSPDVSYVAIEIPPSHKARVMVQGYVIVERGGLMTHTDPLLFIRYIFGIHPHSVLPFGAMVALCDETKESHFMVGAQV